MFNLISFASITSLTVGLAFVYSKLSGKRPPKGLVFPPGPPGKFLIGNLQDLPPGRLTWETVADWKKTYGDIIGLNVLGQPMIFLNSSELAFEFFVKQSSIYSDRTEFPMVVDLMGWGWNVALMRYGDQWRRGRKFMHQELHLKAAEKFRPMQLKHTRLLLQRLVDSPEKFSEHLRHTAGAIIMESVYGIIVQPENDPYIDVAERAMGAVGAALMPGMYLVDTFPILRYIPAWFPGAKFRRDAKLWREDSEAMSVRPFEFVKDALRSGYAPPSMTARALKAIEVGKRPATDETIIQGAGSTLYAGGADTTVGVLRTFILAMLLFPDVQRRAQEELDHFVGPERLPTFEDLKVLPYIYAIYKETLRWQPLLPLALVHVARQDSFFEKYFIPKGTLLFPNVWCIMRNEAVYGAETDKFKPERFLVPGVRDPEEVFGSGRRICPGRHFAKQSLLIAIASILHAFSISPPRDAEGSEIPVEEKFISALFSFPAPFQCTIKARSAMTAQLIAQEEYDL